MNKTLIENYIKEAISWIDIIDSNSLAKSQAKQMIQKALDLIDEEDEAREIVVINTSETTNEV